MSKEKAILVTLDLETVERDSPALEMSKELEELCVSAGLQVMQNFVFRQKAPNPALLMGKGKAEEIKVIAQKEGARVVVFESSLSSTQQRNLEEIIGTKTIDRTQLILDIFAQRARSTEGQLQVELAQLQYLLPRLAGKGIYLSRLGGGVGTRGPGEQKLEVDRRRIRERISRLSHELARLDQRRLAAIEKKKEKELPVIALVGYTNAGKSSLFNALTSSNAIVKNKLFSTLDTTTRSVELPGNQKVLIADTVGFVRDLPHHLVESFKATLEEAIHADILIHVIDATRPDILVLEKSVDAVLEDLGVDQKPIIALNKTDLLNTDELKALLIRHDFSDAVLISAKTRAGFEELFRRINDQIEPPRHEEEVFIPKEKLGLAGFLYDEAEVIKRVDHPEGSALTVNITDKVLRIFYNRLRNREF